MAQQLTRGLINDSISNMLTCIRNATLAKKSTVSIPFTKLNQQIAQILEKEGFIQTFQISYNLLGIGSNKESLVPSKALVETLSFPLLSTKWKGSEQGQDLSRTEILVRLKYRSKTVYKGKKKESCITNLRRISKPGLRIYANHREIPRILGGTGIVILSTSEGVMTDREARFRCLGGELLCSVW